MQPPQDDMSDGEQTMYTDMISHMQHKNHEMVEAEGDVYEESKIIGSQAVWSAEERQVSDVLQQFEDELELVESNEDDFVGYNDDKPPTIRRASAEQWKLIQKTQSLAGQQS